MIPTKSIHEIQLGVHFLAQVTRHDFITIHIHRNVPPLLPLPDAKQFPKQFLHHKSIPAIPGFSGLPKETA